MTHTTGCAVAVAMLIMPTSCGSPERADFRAVDTVASPNNTEDAREDVKPCLLAHVDYIFNCVFLVGPNETMMRNDEKTEEKGVRAYSFVVADMEGFVRSQCELLVRPPQELFTEDCDASHGFHIYRASVVNP